MNCPQCGGATTTHHTFSRGAHTFRIRKCVSCKTRFGTTESINPARKLLYADQSADYRNRVRVAAKACGLGPWQYKEVRRVALAEARRLGKPKEELYAKYGVLPP